MWSWCGTQSWRTTQQSGGGRNWSATLYSDRCSWPSISCKHWPSFQVASLSIDTCVTFDRHGVSGHRNHISLYYALACLAMEDRERSVFCLTSVNLLRKYSGVVDVPMTFLVCPTVYLAGLAQWFQLQRAMMAHWSQVVIAVRKSNKSYFSSTHGSAACTCCSRATH